MQEFTAAINSEGQVILPAEVLQHLHAKIGDQIIFAIYDEDEVRLRVPRYPDIQLLCGAAGSLKKPPSWQQMREIAQEDRFRAKHE